MRFAKRTLACAILSVLLGLVPYGVAQKSKGMQPMPAPSAQQQHPPAAQPQQPSPQVVVVEPVRVYDPFFDYPYPYTYDTDYMNNNFGYVKLDTKLKDASVYVDGGFANKIDKAKKFALRPGNHDIEVKDNDGRSVFKERIAVLVGKTTTLKVS